MPGNDSTTSDVLAQYCRGLLLRGRHKPAEAADELRPLIQRTDSLGMMARCHYTLAMRSLASQAVAAGDFDIALGLLKSAIHATNEQGDVTDLLAGLYASAGRNAECLRELDMPPAAQTNADSPLYHRRLAQAQWQAGLREDAYLTLSRAMRRFGDKGVLHLQHGLFLSAEERYAEARESLSRAARLECDNPDAYRYLAMAAAAEGDAPAAARNFQRAIDLCPDDLMLAYQLSLAAKASAQAGAPIVVRLPVASSSSGPIGSLGELARQIADDPDLADALCSMPGHEHADDLFVTLASTVELAIETRPRDARLYVAACRIYRRLGQTLPAESRAFDALTIDPTCRAGRLQLAELATEAGKHNVAAAHYRAVIAGGADWSDIHLRAGKALLRCGRGDEASIHLRRSLELRSVLATPAHRAREQLAA